LRFLLFIYLSLSLLLLLLLLLYYYYSFIHHYYNKYFKKEPREYIKGNSANVFILLKCEFDRVKIPFVFMKNIADKSFNESVSILLNIPFKNFVI